MTAHLQNIGFDCEGHRFTRGRKVSRMVCLSLYGRDVPPAYLAPHIRRAPSPGMAGYAAGDWSAVLTGVDAVEVFRALLVDGGVRLVAHNAAFDLAVMSVAAATRPGSKGPFLSAIFAALDAGRIACTQVRESLLSIAYDRTKYDPVTNTHALFSLAHCMLRYFGIDRSAEKGEEAPCPDTACAGGRLGDSEHGPTCPTCGGFGLVGPWRLRYYQLDGVPVTQWPDAAVAYAIDDARDALWVWGAQSPPAELPAGVVVNAGKVTDEDAQIRAAVALFLTSCHGPRTDAAAIEELAAAIEAEVAEGLQAAIAAGFVRDANGYAHADPVRVPCAVHYRDGVKRTKKNDFPPEECELCRGTGEKPKRGDPFTRAVEAQRAMVARAYGGGDQVPRTKPNKEGKGGGNVSCDSDTLLGSGDPALVAYAESGEARKLSETYVPLLRLGVDRPLTSDMGFLLTTGRASARNPTLQTGPRKGPYRECFVARPGRCYVACDYHLAELCSLAQAHIWMGLGDTMARALRDGEDLHLRLAATLCGGTDYATAVTAYTDPTHPQHATFAGPNGLRQVAKVGNFGFPGGLGPVTFVAYARGQGVTLAPTNEEAVARARWIRDAWMAEWPEMAGYFDQVSRATAFGSTTVRQFVSGRIRGGVGFCDGCNTIFQGLTADGAKRAMYEVTRACFAGGETSALYRHNCRPWNFVHDEIIIEAPDEGVADTDGAHALTACADELSRIMVAAMQAFCPDVPIAANPAAMRRWSKKAKEVRDNQGRLKLWQSGSK